MYFIIRTVNLKMSELENHQKLREILRMTEDNVNFTNIDGDSIFMSSIYFKQYNFAIYLLENYDIDIHIKNKNGCNALHLLCDLKCSDVIYGKLSEYYKIFDILISKGLNIIEPDGAVEGPLIATVRPIELIEPNKYNHNYFYISILNFNIFGILKCIEYNGIILSNINIFNESWIDIIEKNIKYNILIFADSYMQYHIYNLYNTIIRILKYLNKIINFDKDDIYKFLEKESSLILTHIHVLDKTEIFKNPYSDLNHPNIEYPTDYPELKYHVWLSLIQPKIKKDIFKLFKELIIDEKACYEAIYKNNGISVLTLSNEEPILVPLRFLTNAYGLTPIRRRIVGYLVSKNIILRTNYKRLF